MLDSDAPVQGEFEDWPLQMEVYDRPEDVRVQLWRRFGLTEEPFGLAVREAWINWANRSEFDARSFPGTLLWGHAVRPFRTYLAGLTPPWPPNDDDGFSTSFSPDGT